jgi:hypothetical protein
VYDDGIDIDQVVRHELFCEFADEMVQEEILKKSFPLAEKILAQMLIDKVVWLNDAFIDSYHNKYNGISINKEDQVSLLMKEAVACYDEQVVYDIFNTAIATEYFSFRSMIYLLNKAVFYSQGYFYPYKMFSYLKKKARYCVDYHLLADSLAVMFEKHHVVNPDAVKRLLDSSREKMHSDYEKFSLAFSYQRNGYSKEAKEIFTSTIDAIVSEIREGKKAYQAVRSLIITLAENGDIGDESCFFCDLENDGSIFAGNGREVCFSWDVELVNRLYGAFYDEN